MIYYDNKGTLHTGVPLYSFFFFHTTAVLENTQYEICKKVLHRNFLWILRAHKQSFIFNLHTSAAQNI